MDGRITRTSREAVAKAGLKLLDAHGLDGLTLRAVAAELGVQAPTLYWRFRDRQDLIAAMAAQLLSDYATMLDAAPAPKRGRLTWAELAHRQGERLRAVLLGHRDGARLAAGVQRTDPSILKARKAALAVFDGADIAAGPAMALMETVGDYAVGFALGAQAADGAHDDARFVRGLGLIIAGFAAGLPTGRRAWLDFRDYQSAHPISDNIP